MTRGLRPRHAGAAQGADRLPGARDILRALIQTSPLAIVVVDPDGLVRVWNVAAERLFGWTEREVLGQPNPLGSDREELGGAREPVLQGASVRRVEVHGRKKDGARVDLSVYATAVCDAAGNVTGMMTMLADITEREPAESEIERRATHLEALNAIIASAAAATDLRQLLNDTLERTLETLGGGMGCIWLGTVHVSRGFSPKVGLVITDVVKGSERSAAGPIGVRDWADAGGREAKGEAALMARSGIRASLTVPIQTEGQAIGGLAIASAQPRSWQADEITLVEAVGKHLGAAAERLRLFRDTQQRARLMAHLVSLHESLNRPLAVSEAVVAIGQGALSLSGADRVAIYLCRPDGAVICPWSLGLSSDHIAEVLARQADLTIGRLMAEALPERLTLAGGRVVEARKPFLQPDLQMLPDGDLVRRVAEREGYRAVGNWPLTYEGRVIAVVSCYYDAPRTWTEPEHEVFLLFCWQAAIALQNAGLREGQAQRTMELEVLSDLSKRLRAARTPEEMYPILVDEAMRLFQADHGTLALLDSGAETLTRVYTVGIPSEVRGSTFPVAGSRSERVVQTGTTFVTEDFQGDPLPAWADPDPYRGIGPWALVPVRSEQEIIGTFGLARKRNPQNRTFSEAEVRLLQAIAEMGGTAVRRARLFQNLEQSYIQMVLALARTVDARDAYTSGHSERVTVWAEAVARALGCGEEHVQEIRWAALLHDIGKVGVPDDILRKPGTLSEAEWAVMRQHPVVGEQILVSTDRMRGVAMIVRHHQEHWDGTGYPDGLRGDEIPLGSRILAVADAYSAMTDDRPYRKARSHDEAVAELQRCAGGQFDLRVVSAFCRVIECTSRDRESKENDDAKRVSAP